MANRGFPSMTALLGLLAVAGYQNRDKIAEMLRGSGSEAGQGGQRSPGQSGTATAPQQAPAAEQQGGIGGLLGPLATSLGGASVGGFLNSGIGELVERFRQAGHGEAAESWVGRGPNKEVAPHQLEQAIGPDVLANLSQQTGLSREELLARLSRELPQAVDQYTPQGRLPSENETHI